MSSWTEEWYGMSISIPLCSSAWRSSRTHLTLSLTLRSVITMHSQEVRLPRTLETTGSSQEASMTSMMALIRFLRNSELTLILSYACFSKKGTIVQAAVVSTSTTQQLGASKKLAGLMLKKCYRLTASKSKKLSPTGAPIANSDKTTLAASKSTLEAPTAIFSSDFTPKAPNSL